MVMKKLLRVACVGLSLILLTACADDETTELTDAQQVEQQIARGGEVYGDKCASCHGASGEGTNMAPAVVGMGVLPKDAPAGAARDVQFVTALDVFVWASQTMPGDAPGTLETNDMLAVFAFALNANGVTLTKPLDGDVAEAIVLNP